MIKKVLFGILALLAAAIAAVLTFQNPQLVLFSYYFGSIQLPLIFVLLLGFCLGLILTLFASSFWVYRQSRQIKRLERSKALVQKELDNLRSLRAE